MHVHIIGTLHYILQVCKYLALRKWDSPDGACILGRVRLRGSWGHEDIFKSGRSKLDEESGRLARMSRPSFICSICRE